MWSLGILLFTLLCGYLPFDDDNMGTLYRKIQLGAYQCPPWLSDESKNVINRMLQTDPKQRITVGSLLMHPWLHQGCGRPIHWRSVYDKEDLDEEVISELSLYFARSKRSIYEELRQWKYDYLMSTYFLLLLKKKKGNFFALSCNKTPLKICQRPNWELSSSLESGLNDADLLLLASPKRESPSLEKSVSSSSEDNCQVILKHDEQKQPPQKQPQKQPPSFDSSDKENFAIPTCPPSTKKYRTKTPRTPAGKGAEMHERSGTPATAVVRKVPKTPCSTRHHHSGETLNQFESPSLFPPIDKRCKSVDMDISGHPISSDSGQSSLPMGGSVMSTPSKGSSARQRVFGSIERRMDKVRNMLTPKKKELFAAARPASPAPTPRRLKVKPTGLYNVSVVGRSGKCQGVSPEAVLDTLQKALECKGIPCNRKGYTLCNKIRNEQTGKVTLAFELEICLLQPPLPGHHEQSTDNPLLGVCRKRLKGDTWMYKNVVEEVLKVLNY